MKRAYLMPIGCVLAFLVAFLLPALGVSSSVTLLVFFALMVACHLLMGGCGGHGKDNHEQT